MTKRYYMFIWLLCDLSWLCRLAEGEMALTGGCLTNSKPLETIASEFGSAAGYGLALLGQICRYFQLWFFLFFVFSSWSNFVTCISKSVFVSVSHFICFTLILGNQNSLQEQQNALKVVWSIIRFYGAPLRIYVS